MKKIIKNNLSIIIVFCIFITFGILGVIEDTKEYNINMKSYNYRVEHCKENKEDPRLGCDELDNYHVPMRYNAYSTFFDLINYQAPSILVIIAPILIIIAALFPFLYKLKNGMLKNIAMREDYMKFVLKEWTKALKATLIIPLFFLIMFIIAFILTKNLDYTTSINYSIHFNETFFSNISFWIFIFILNFIIQSIFWINIGFIVGRNSKNIVLTFILSFLVYLGIWAFLEIYIGEFIGAGLLNNPTITNYVSLTTIWNYIGIENTLIFTLIQIALAFISFLIFTKMYKNKEKVLINNEG